MAIVDSVYAFLKERLEGVQRLAVLGAGSTLKADDAAGVRVVESLQVVFDSKRRPELLLCVGETAPENYSGKIKGFCPTHILVIDAADLGHEAGRVVEIRPQDVGGPTFCSHMLPIRVMIDYLKAETGADVTLLGIQYKSIAFDGEMSPEVRRAADALGDSLKRVIRERWGL